MNTDEHRFETKILRRSTNLKYIGVNLMLAGLAFLAGAYFFNGMAEGNLPQSQAGVRNITASPTGLVRPAGEIFLGTDPEARGEELSVDEIMRRLTGLGPLSSERAYDRMKELLLTLAANNPKAAVDYILHNLKPPFRNQMLTGVLGVWADHDGRSAWDWVKANQAGDSLMTGAVLNKVGILQPEVAWQFAAELATNRPDQAAGLYVSAMSGMMYAGKYAEAARLLSSAMLPTNAPGSGFALTGLLAGQWGEFAPSEASQWVLALPDGEGKSRALVALGQSWAGVDPVQAVAFASQLPPGTERVSMIEAGLNSWLANDPAAAGAWMASIAPGPDYDQFASAIANTPAMMNQSPESSVAWAMSISDSNLKMESVVSVFTEWFHSADGAAMGYLKQMPPEVQRVVSERLKLAGP